MGNLFYKVKLVTGLFIGALLCASGSSAATISPALVGGEDTYLGLCDSATPSSVADEIACFGTFGLTVTGAEMEKDETLSFELVDGTANTYAQLLPVGYNGGYFLIKTGGIGEPGDKKQYFFIFQNLINMDYAVVNLGGLPFDISDVEKFSHITGISAVPLPAAAWMMITALGGMFGFRKIGLRRRKKT